MTSHPYRKTTPIFDARYNYRTPATDAHTPYMRGEYIEVPTPSSSFTGTAAGDELSL